MQPNPYRGGGQPRNNAAVGRGRVPSGNFNNNQASQNQMGSRGARNPSGPGRGGNDGGFRGGGRGGAAPSNRATGPQSLNLNPAKTKLCKLQINDSIKLVKRPTAVAAQTSGINVKTFQVGVNTWDIDFAEKDVIMYDVDVQKITPASDETRVLKIPLKDMATFTKIVVEEFYNQDGLCYDGGRIIYSIKALEGVNRQGIVRSLLTGAHHSRDELKITYKIAEVQTVTTASLKRFVTNKNATVLNMPQEAIRLLDCIFRTLCGKELINQRGNSYFYPTPEKICADKLFVIHKGFLTSVRPQWKVRVNIDMTCKAFFMTGNLADVLYEKYRDNIYSPASFQAITGEIRNLRVEAEFYKNTKTGKNYKKKLIVTGLSSKSAAETIIEDLKISVKDYYLQHHKITLKYPELPCASMSTKREVYIPMELLTILPFQPTTANKGDVASEIVRCAAVRPQERFKTLMDYAQMMKKNDNALSRMYGLKISDTNLKCEAKHLPQPVASFGANVTPLGIGKWNVPRFKMPADQGKPIKWGILMVMPRGNSSNIFNMVIQEFVPAASQMGVSLMNNPVQVDRVMLAQVGTQLQNLQKSGCRFGVIVLFDKNSYGTVKRFSDIELGIPTQCVMDKTLFKGRVGANLLLKLNGKLGGVNWSIPSVVSPKELIQVFGVDVTHPGPGGRKELQKSVAAVTGSVTPDLMRYATVIRQQATVVKGNNTSREIVDSMDVIMTDLLQTFAVKNGNKFPDRLIIYRDGVSEGQFQQVLVHELAAIQKACKGIRPDYEPAITYITVQKRHAIRFNPLDGARNVEPGTLVEKEITSNSEFDFYLCSHEGIMGTSKPAHYFVLYDDSNWYADALQFFTYALCHAYFRCPRSVSYPAPTYYSHLAAFRAREWINGGDSRKLVSNDTFKIHENQKLSMFFL